MTDDMPEATEAPTPEAEAPIPDAEVTDYGEVTQEEKLFALGSHIGFAITGGLIVIPLIAWLIKKDDSPFVADHAKEALNFQITMLGAYMISAASTLVLIGFLLLPVVGLMHLIFSIMASVKAFEGQGYVYPFNIRLIT